jgi:ABC-type sugar transport system permease subunit
MATYAYSISMGGGKMGLGSAAALAMVPALGLILLAMSWYVRRD